MLDIEIIDYFLDMYRRIDDNKSIDEYFDPNIEYQRFYTGNHIHLLSKQEVLDFYNNKGEIKRNLEGKHIIEDSSIDQFQRALINNGYYQKTNEGILTFSDYLEFNQDLQITYRVSTIISN